MTEMLLSALMALHLAGVVLWFGGALAACRVLWELARARPEARESLERIERLFLYYAAVPGMCATLAGGLALRGFNSDYFAAQGWLSVKLVLAILPVAASLVLAHARWRKPAAAEAPRLPKAAAIVLGASLALILLLSCVRPF